LDYLTTDTRLAMLDDEEVRDCALLATAVYMRTEAEIGGFLARKGHRFNRGIICSNIPNNEGSFLLAQMTGTRGMATYLAVRGSTVAEDWVTNVQVTPTLQGIGTVHAGWFARMRHLPQLLLAQCIRDGHRVVICGHSLGAAVAQVVTLSLLQDLAGGAERETHCSNIKCVSFAGPMVLTGNVAVDQVNGHFKDNFVNFVHFTDIVPKVLSSVEAAITGKLFQCRQPGDVTRMVTTLHSAVDQAACGQTTEQVLSNAIRPFGAAFAGALAYRPIGFYYRTDAPIGTPLLPLSDAEVETFLSWGSAEFSVDALYAHSMMNTYLPGTTARRKSSVNLFALSWDSPARIALPRPTIKSVDLQRSGNQYLVRITGSDLHMSKMITSSALPQCKLKHMVCTKDLISAEQLMFTVDTLPSAPSAVSATSTANFSVSQAFCWRETFEALAVPVRVVDSHPMDRTSLQELVMRAIFLLMVLSREPGHHDHPHVTILRKQLIEILKTVPLAVFLSASSPVSTHCFQEYAETLVPALLNEPGGRQVIKDYIQNTLERLRDEPDSEDVKARRRHIVALQNQMKKHNNNLSQKCRSKSPVSPLAPRRSRNRRPSQARTRLSAGKLPDNILAMLARNQEATQEGHLKGLDVLLEVIAGAFLKARAVLQSKRTPEACRTFTDTLAAALKSVEALAVTLGKYFSPPEPELGLLNSALKNRWVRSSMQWASRGLLAWGGIASIVSMCTTCVTTRPSVLSLIAGAALTATGSKLDSMFGGFPSHVVASSDKLCATLAAHLRCEVPEGATTGEVEAMVARSLAVEHGFRPFDDSTKLNELLYECFADVSRHHMDFPLVGRRTKLVALSDALRGTLKRLPVALITGPIRSGKSTFREHMHTDGPNPNSFGRYARHRTPVTELFFCGDPAYPIGLLDFVGLGDSGGASDIDDFVQANGILRLFCQATVIVVHQHDASEVGEYLMRHTSASVRPTALPDATPVLHPTITCITHVDEMLGTNGTFPVDVDRPFSLRKEVVARKGRGEPFDLRSPKDDPFTPRVLACFEGRIPLPDTYDGVVHTTAQVGEWLRSHLHPISTPAMGRPLL
jgi:pimeloyl-ACP methyl ester carboxylesterase